MTDSQRMLLTLLALDFYGPLRPLEIKNIFKNNWYHNMLWIGIDFGLIVFTDKLKITENGRKRLKELFIQHAPS